MADALVRATDRALEKLLLRPAETAEVLGMSRSKTYELIGSGAIPSITIGKSRRVPVAGLRAWIEAQQTAQQPERPDAA